MRLILPALLVVALASPAAAAASGTTGYFETPSTNIVCGYFHGNASPAVLECGLNGRLVPAAPKPRGGCRMIDPASNRVRLGATGRVYGFCSGDVGVLALRGRAPVLAYGATWHRGPFRCTSAITGLTCRNRAGHGFFLSRDAWRSL